MLAAIRKSKKTLYIGVGILCVYIAGSQYYKMHKTPSKQSNSRIWSKIKYNGIQDIYIYSVYHDDRENSYVRIPAHVQVKPQNRSYDNLKCRFANENNSFASTDVIMNRSGYNLRIHGMVFNQYLLSCSVPSYITHPLSVTLTDEYGALIDLRITYPERPKRKMLIINCVPRTYFYISPARLVESIELQRILGIEKIFVYNMSVAAPTMRIINYYERQGFIHRKSYPSPWTDGPGNATPSWPEIRGTSTPGLTDCLYHNLHSTQKIMITDFDEFVVPRIDTTYAGLLQRLARLARNKWQSYTFFNIYFIANASVYNDQSRLLTMNSVHRRRSPSLFWLTPKSIVDANSCMVMHNHICVGYLPRTRLNMGNGQLEVRPTVAWLHHYKRCPFAPYGADATCEAEQRATTRDTAMHRYKARLEAAVLRTVTELTLVSWDIT